MWWEASFEIPKGAVAVNFVVNCENAWDNNGGKDHKVRRLLWGSPSVLETTLHRSNHGYVFGH